MEDLDLPDDLGDVEVIYSDGEDDENPFDDDFPEELPEDLPPVVDLSKFTFTKHTKSVFCSDISQDGQLAVTGGQDDVAYVWSTSTGEIILECTGHGDSVTQVCFNYNSQLVATGDMSGMIQVWSIKEKKLLWCYDGEDMEWLIWHSLANVLISGSHSGDVYIWQVPQGNCKVLPSHGSPCTCGKLLSDGKHLIAGYGDGQIKFWDLKSVIVSWQYADPNNTSITSLDVNGDETLLSVAPMSSLLKLTDGKFICNLLLDGENEIEAHVFNNELNVLITGSISGQLCTWDVARHAIRHQAKIECAVTVLKMESDGNKLYVGATDGAIYVCDIRGGTLLNTLTGHSSDVLSMCIFKDGTILSTSDDGTAKIFA